MAIHHIPRGRRTLGLVFSIICIPTAGKLVDVVALPLSISIYCFPFVHIFPILGEVYGYAVAARVLWYCIFAQIVMSGSFLVVVFYPPSAVMTNNQSYAEALSTGSSSLILSRLGSILPLIGQFIATGAGSTASPIGSSTGSLGWS